MSIYQPGDRVRYTSGILGSVPVGTLGTVHHRDFPDGNVYVLWDGTRHTRPIDVRVTSIEHKFIKPTTESNTDMDTSSTFKRGDIIQRTKESRLGRSRYGGTGERLVVDRASKHAVTGDIVKDNGHRGRRIHGASSGAWQSVGRSSHGLVFGDKFTSTYSSEVRTVEIIRQSESEIGNVAIGQGSFISPSGTRPVVDDVDVDETPPMVGGYGGFGERKVVVIYEHPVAVGEVWEFNYPTAEGDSRARIVRVEAIHEGGDIGGIDLSRRGGYRRFKPAKVTAARKLYDAVWSDDNEDGEDA